MRARAAFFCAAAVILAGCQTNPPRISDSVDGTANRVEYQAEESHTRAALASLEESLNSYIRENGRIPENLDLLVPKYIAEIPSVETGYHYETDKVKIYPASILRDGQIDGMQLKDSGRWGYVFNDRQVIVFVDCTHRASDGKAWYLHRGVY